MAGSSSKQDLLEKTLADLEKEITCAVCHEHYTEPKFLPCLHCYCKRCVQKLAVKAGEGKPFFCPECRQSTTLPAGKEEELKTAFPVNRLKSMYEKHKQILGRQGDVNCGACRKAHAKAQAFCKQCDKYFCQDCLTCHVRMVGFFEGHNVVQQHSPRGKDDLQGGIQSPNKCHIHSEPLKGFCFDCDKLVCCDCIVGNHRAHRVQFKNIAAQELRAELREDLKPVKEASNSLALAVNEVSDVEHGVQSQKQAVTDAIQAYFCKLCDILEKRKVDLIREAEEKAGEKMDLLQHQRKRLSSSKEKVSRVIEYAEQCVENCSDEHIMSMHKDISQLMQQVVKEQYESCGVSLVPVAEADLMVELDCAETLQQICLTKARVKQLPASVSVNLPGHVKINEKFERVIVASLDNLYPVNNLTSHLMTVYDKMTIEVSMERRKSGEFAISFTPASRGRHELHLSVSGQPVHGNPFPVFVSISPTQLDKPLKVWENIKKPASIAVNSLGEIVIAEFSGSILVLNNEGVRLKSITPSELKIGRLNGLALDKDDNIYYIDFSSERIGKSNRECSNITVSRTKTLQCFGRRSIAVVQNLVMVIECGNTGEILLFDKKLHYLRTINGNDSTCLNYLTPSSNTLYVSKEHGTIQVIKSNGNIHYLDYSKNSNQAVLDPYHLHVSGNFLYINNRKENTTVVLSTEGSYVAMIGGVSGPMCVDQDGFLYVGDFWKESGKLYCY